MLPFKIKNTISTSILLIFLVLASSAENCLNNDCDSDELNDDKTITREVFSQRRVEREPRMLNMRGRVGSERLVNNRRIVDSDSRLSNFPTRLQEARGRVEFRETDRFLRNVRDFNTAATSRMHENLLSIIQDNTRREPNVGKLHERLSHRNLNAQKFERIQVSEKQRQRISEQRGVKAKEIQTLRVDTQHFITRGSLLRNTNVDAFQRRDSRNRVGAERSVERRERTDSRISRQNSAGVRFPQRDGTKNIIKNQRSVEKRERTNMDSRRNTQNAIVRDGFENTVRGHITAERRERIDIADSQSVIRASLRDRTVRNQRTIEIRERNDIKDSRRNARNVDRRASKNNGNEEILRGQKTFERRERTNFRDSRHNTPSILRSQRIVERRDRNDVRDSRRNSPTMVTRSFERNGNENIVRGRRSVERHERANIKDIRQTIHSVVARVSQRDGTANTLTKQKSVERTDSTDIRNPRRNTLSVLRTSQREGFENTVNDQGTVETRERIYNTRRNTPSVVARRNVGTGDRYQHKSERTDVTKTTRDRTADARRNARQYDEPTRDYVISRYSQQSIFEKANAIDENNNKLNKNILPNVFNTFLGILLLGQILHSNLHSKRFCHIKNMFAATKQKVF